MNAESSEHPARASGKTPRASENLARRSRHEPGTYPSGQLTSELGNTAVTDTVVAKVAGIATREMPGVYAMGAGMARAVGVVRDRRSPRAVKSPFPVILLRDLAGTLTFAGRVLGTFATCSPGQLPVDSTARNHIPTLAGVMRDRSVADATSPCDCFHKRCRGGHRGRPTIPGRPSSAAGASQWRPWHIERATRTR